MKVLHTADWHIGQLFHEFDRSYEHSAFLEWLLLQLISEKIDVLLISGDVFDISNPSAHSIKLFYTFLRKAILNSPDLQIIIIAGNHDSASRLEAPKPLLESFNIHITGLVQKKEDGTIDFEKLLIPITGRSGLTEAWCLAIPFLRIGDYPILPESQHKYAEGVKALYQQAYQFALTKTNNELPIMALGHLHVQSAEITDLDQSERQIMGGVEAISTSAFHKDIRYVALGHIHKAQRLGGQDHIRYSGSPIPLSFSELNYKHQVVIFDLARTGIEQLRSIEVPVAVPLLRIPSQHRPLKIVLKELEELPAVKKEDAFLADHHPYLEVRVLLDEPQPALRHKIETVLAGKNVRLAKIDVKYPTGHQTEDRSGEITEDRFNELRPAEVFRKIYAEQFQNEVPDAIEALFQQVVTEVDQNNKA